MTATATSRSVRRTSRRAVRAATVVIMGSSVIVAVEIS